MLSIGSVFFSLALLSPSISQDSTINEPKVQQVNEFELPGIDKQAVKLLRGSQPTVVIFLGTECPLAKLYSARIQEIVSSFDDQVTLVGVSSNRQDSTEDLVTFAEKHKIRFPIGKDYQNKIADRFGATRTPEVFLLDPKLNIRYRGRIDDQYDPGITRAAPTRHFLKLAIQNLLAGKKLEVTQTEPVGCLIGKVKTKVTDSDVTYCNQIARLLQKHCIECHRVGEIGPFSLTDYDEVVGWSDMMLEVVEQQRMPPWHANPQHGEFLNSRIMTKQEKKWLAEWVQAGAPYGDRKELPEPVSYPTGWNLTKEPDETYQMKRPFDVPSEGVIEYQYFVVDPKLKEDKWVTAAQILPGNRSVVHHSIVFVRPPDGGRFRGIGWLSAYVPGQRAFVLPKGRARLIPAGSKFVFQQHYTPNGSPQTDQTRLGLVFADPEEVTHEVFTLAGIEQEFEIPANAKNHKVSLKIRNLPRYGSLLSISPHMHLRGKSFRAFAETETSKGIICDVPHYDFNWQHTYVFKKPLSFESLKDISFDVYFDNSSGNPVNPDPNQLVTWGDQTFEEMAVAFFDVAVPLKIPEPASKTPKKTNQGEPSAKVIAFVDRFFERFDKNRNELVEKSETPISLQGFGFWKYDANRDSKLSRDEVTRAARVRIRK